MEKDNIFGEGFSLNNIDELVNLNFSPDAIKNIEVDNNNSTKQNTSPNGDNIIAKESNNIFDDSVFDEQDSLLQEYNKIRNTPNKEQNNTEEVIEEKPTAPVTKDNKVNVVDDKTITEDTKDFPLIPYVNSILEAGLLPNFNKEEFSKLTTSEEQAEFLIKSQEDEIITKAESILEDYVKRLPTRLRTAFENYSGGINLEDSFGFADKLDKLKNYPVDSLEDKETAKRMIKEDLKEQGLDDETIEDTLDNMISYTDVAKKSLNKRIQRTEKKIETEKKNTELREVEDKKQKEQQVKQIKTYIESSSEFIQGIPLTQQQKKEIYDTMMIPVSKDEQGNPIGKIAQDRAKDPLAFETKFTQAYVLTKGFTDLSVLMNMRNTKAVKSLEEQLRSTTIQTDGTPATYNSGKRSGESLMDAIKRTTGTK